MTITTLLYIILAVFISSIIAFFQYFYKVKNSPKHHILLFCLKALSLFLIGILLINPKVTSTKKVNNKPILNVLVDNSISVKHFKEENNVLRFVENIKKNSELNKKFDLTLFSFGKSSKILDSLSFNETQTDITKAIQLVNNLQKDQLGATVLLSDGNQTIGNDYEFLYSDKAINPVVLGDTIQYKDIRISQLNVNKYSYIKNKFPVEAMLYYNGDKTVTTTFTITQSRKKVFSKKVSFSKEKNTQTITANLNSTKEGVQYYTAGIHKIKGEKNTKNNYKSFSVEVINEQTNILILSAIMHPDLGALKKAIESNKQHKVHIALAHKFKEDLSNYQLVFFYQPNGYFRNAFAKRKSNFVIISGAKTDWNFINQQKLGFSKNSIYQKEDYGAVYNSKFLTFLQKDIGFNQFSPLQDKFGELNVTANHQVLLFQKVVGIATKNPLIASFENGEQKFVGIFGEGIWKWRAASFIKEQSFEQFDEFIGNIVQYTASNKKRKRLEVKAKRLYPANSEIVFSALYLDKNYRFDSRASLQISITNSETKKKQTLPFSLMNNFYQVNIEGLPAGNYTYKVAVSGQNLNSYGRFKIDNYQVEEQFTNANHKKLQQLALKTKGTLFYQNQEDDLITNLLQDKRYYTVQKLVVKEENLINWKWILFLIIALLTVEWFLRKYYGKI